MSNTLHTNSYKHVCITQCSFYTNSDMHEYTDVLQSVNLASYKDLLLAMQTGAPCRIQVTSILRESLIPIHLTVCSWIALSVAYHFACSMIIKSNTPMHTFGRICLTSTYPVEAYYLFLRVCAEDYLPITLYCMKRRQISTVKRRHRN